jgi:hypothetical protein
MIHDATPPNAMIHDATPPDAMMLMQHIPTISTADQSNETAPNQKHQHQKQINTAHHCTTSLAYRNSANCKMSCCTLKQPAHVTKYTTAQKQTNPIITSFNLQHDASNNTNEENSFAILQVLLQS